jgi:hydrophobe/amphiphile efflux-1 (HAE1) family protein
MMMCAFIIFGAIGFSRLGVSDKPDIDFPVVTVKATLEGAAPEIMESDVADVIEDSVMAVEGIKEVSSTCKQGEASVTIEFDLKRDINQALQDVQSKVSQAGKTLPKDMDPPIISKTNPEDQPIMWMALTGTVSPRELSEYAKNVLRDRFLTIPGVGDVRMGGYLARNVRIWLKQDQLLALGLGADEVITAIQRQHVELPAGRIDATTRMANVRVEGEALNLEQVRNLQIADRNGSPVYLKDVALVEDGFEDKTRIARSDGIPAQGLGIIKQRGFSAVEVAKAMHKRVEEVRRDLPEGMSLEIRVDNTKFIESAIHEIEHDLLFAVLLTAIVCWLFLGSISSTFNVVLAIPVSVFGTFAVMYFAGFTLNTFSLLALSLSIGIVVDDAIMVLENIYRHAEEGEDKVTASRRGTEQITFAALAATMAIIAIFLPVAFMQGIIGKFFFQFGVVLSVAVIISLFEALTLAPARCSQFLRVTGRGNAVERAVGAAFNGLSRFYKWSLRRALNWRLTVLALSFAIFGASVWLPFHMDDIRAKLPARIADRIPGSVKSEFVPAWDMGFFMINFTTPVGSSIDYTDRTMAKLEAILNRFPAIAGKLAIAGSRDLNGGIIFVTLGDADKRPSQQQVMAELRPALNVFPGVRVSLFDFSQAGFTGSGRNYPVEFTNRGPDWKTLGELTNKVIGQMRNSGVMADVDTDYRVGLPEVQVVPNRERALSNDVDVQSIAQVVNSLIGGQRVAKFKDNGRRYDVRVRLVQNQRLRPEDIANLYVRNRSGHLVPLSEVTTIKVAASVQSMTRKQRERATSAFANPAPGHSLQEALDVVNEIKKTLPDGYNIVFSGGSQAAQESFESLIFAMILGLAVAYMVLASQFNSLIHPLSVLLALPFSVTGAFLAIYLTGITINLYSMIGIILLLGIVKKNSILLVDYTYQVRSRGLPTKEALLEACPVRLRPILMTTCAMIAGAFPGAVASGIGHEVRRPMNISVIGGLIISTMLTLFVVPCFYSLSDQALAWLTRLWRKRKPAQPQDTPPASPTPVVTSSTAHEAFGK